jgi:hypothetical protein
LPEQDPLACHAHVPIYLGMIRLVL